MAIIKQCDRCQQVVKHEVDEMSVIQVLHPSQPGPGTFHDLCSKCTRELDRFMKNLDKKIELEEASCMKCGRRTLNPLDNKLTYCPVGHRVIGPTDKVCYFFVPHRENSSDV